MEKDIRYIYYHNFKKLINIDINLPITVLYCLSEASLKSYKLIVDGLLEKFTKIKKYEINNLDDWINQTSNRCILLIDCENTKTIDIVKRKYDKSNYQYFNIITSLGMYLSLPKILNSSYIDKMFIFDKLHAIIIYTKKTYPYTKYQIPNTDKLKIIASTVDYYKSTNNSLLYNSLMWKKYIDFDKFYFHFLKYDKRIYNTILYKNNLFYRIIDLLNKNNIEYRADAGTLLGAKKWGGCILHDGDFDVVMLPPEQDKLVKTNIINVFSKKYNLIFSLKHNNINKCATLRLDHKHIPFHADLYGLKDYGDCYILCHSGAGNKESKYAILKDEFLSKPSTLKFGKIEIKTYSQEKVIQYLDRTYWGWYTFVHVRDPSLYKLNDFHFIRSLYFVNNGAINLKNRDSYEKIISDDELKKLEKELMKYYIVHPFDKGIFND